jgi:hypothetical protein
VDATDTTLFAVATRVTVHNGKTARFWTDNWLNGSTPASLFLVLFQHCKRKNRIVSDSICNDNWVRDVMHNISSSLLADCVMLWSLIDAVEVDLEDSNER